MSTANDIQVGGQHYKVKTIQPWDYIAANGLGYFDCNIVKYVTRWRVDDADIAEERARLAHTPDWCTYKIVANGRAANKANYWLARNKLTGQIGFARDYVCMFTGKQAIHADTGKPFADVKHGNEAKETAAA